MSRWRRGWLLAHRWAGLVAGVWLVVIGLTGSYLTFYPEIDRWLNPDWATPRTRVAAPATMQRVLDQARADMPDHFLHSVFPPAGPNDVHHVWFTPSASDQSRMWEVLVDPVDARVLGRREAVPTLDFSRRNLGNAVYTLHFQLLMGDNGSTLVGFIGLLALASSLSGLAIWWPRGMRRAAWRQALSFKRGSHGIRLHFDLHRLAAIYSLLVLVTVVFTGVTMTFGSQTRAVLDTVSSVRTDAEAPLPPQSGAGLDADQALRLALLAVPEARVQCLWLPGAAGPAWRVSLREAQGVGWAGGRAEVWLHPQGGRVLEQWRHEQGSGGDTYLAWQLPLHDGSAFGLPGRIVACVLGFIPLLLAITGTTIWWRKRAGRKAASRIGATHPVHRLTSAGSADASSRVNLTIPDEP